MSPSEPSSPQIRSVPSFLNNDGIDQLTPLQHNNRPSNLSLSDQWVGLNSAKNSFANLTTAGSFSNLRVGGRSRSSSLANRSIKQTKIDHPRIANYAFAFDIDGVIVKGPDTIPQARDALKMLNGANPYNIKVPYIFVTNGGGRSEKARSEELSKRLGVKIEENQVIQGHTPMKDLVSKFKTVLVIGGVGDACRKVAEGYGFQDVVTPLDIMKWKPSVTPYHTLTEDELKVARDRDFSKIEIEAILVFADSRSWAADQQIILELLLSKNGVMGTVSPTFDEGPGIYFAHSDFLWSTNYGLSRYGMGALQVSIAAIYGEHTGKELTVTRFGKPQRGTFRYADKVLNLWRKNELEQYVAKEMADLKLDEHEQEEAKDKVPSQSNVPSSNNSRPSLKSRISNSKFQMAIDSDTDDSDSEDDSEDDIVTPMARSAAGQTPAETGDLVLDLDLPQSSTVYFVGDTPESDIRFANSHDSTWYSILVNTGVYQPGTTPKYKPKHMCTNVLEAVKYAIEREHEMELSEWNKNAEELAKLRGSSSSDGNAVSSAGLRKLSNSSATSNGNLNSLRRGSGGAAFLRPHDTGVDVTIDARVKEVADLKTGEAVLFE
ncbi:hypothetical protein DASC09_042110 [Saccharomycopsis crataegensis]|uniref:Phosphatidyl synthase n=1 Tax=Saccharomycopsis crataegensis TaxID=43959 RepID=A0AAV5QQN8_9ASCO|nr:hypothetical protein DASC09_042110 [Saccharomycopsis crataegensis]